MRLVENIIHAIRPTPTYFRADGSVRDAVAALRRSYESPREIDPSKLPVEFARRVQIAYERGMTAEADNLQALDPRELTPTTEESQPDTLATLDSSLQEPLVTHYPAKE